MSESIKLESINQVHELLGYEKPKHPHITVIQHAQMKGRTPHGAQIENELYLISFKDGAECDLKCGRRKYDFQEGSLVFIAPGQTYTIGEEDKNDHYRGWTMMFHPDLIRGTGLGSNIRDYTFFSYESNEALHLSDKERTVINNIIATIEDEYSQNIDVHTAELLVSHLELFLNYSKRFYGRQFITRSTTNKDTITRFESYLNNYFHSNKLKDSGIPSVKQCAFEMGYSTDYLSDLLRKETGKTTLEHIHYRLIDKAKDLLLGPATNVNQVASELGFEYTQSFSKLFKKRTGMSPSGYRNQELNQ